MDTVDKLKQELNAELNVQYRNLVNFLQRLPINEKFKDHGFMNLDQGYRWMKDGIELISVQTTAPDVPPNEEPKIEDVIKPETIQ